MKGQYIRSANGAKDSENPICTLFSSQPIYKKLAWISKIFSGPNILSYVPNINEYLSSLEKKFGPNWDHWPKDAVSYMEHLQFHKEAKSKIGSFLKAPIKGLLAVQFKLLGLGLKLGWYKASEKKAIKRRLLGDLFLRNLTLEEKDQVCSLDAQIDLELEGLPQEKWNRYTIDALGCIRPSSESVHMALAETLEDPDKYVRESAAWPLGEIKPQNETIHMALAEAIKDTDSYVRSYAAWALGEIKPQNETIHMALAEALKDTNSSVREYAAWTLGQIKPQSLKVLFFITELLKNTESYVRKSAAWALGQIKPQSPKVLDVIKRHNPDLYQKIISE